MPPYPIYCISAGCTNLASYKIAGSWSDGVQGELKTFALTCAECLPKWFRLSLAKQKHQQALLASNESLDVPGIYLLERGRRDRALTRLVDLETKLTTSSPP